MSRCSPAFGRSCSAQAESSSSAFDQYECSHWRDDGTRVSCDRVHRNVAFWKSYQPSRTYLTLDRRGSPTGMMECAGTLNSYADL